MLPRVWPLLLLVAALLVPALPAARAAPDPTTGSTWIDASLDLAQPTVTVVSITGTLHVHKYGFPDGTYTAQDMASSFNGANRFGGAVGDQFVANAESNVAKGFSDSLNASFPKSQYPSVQIVVTKVQVDRTTLAAGGSGSDAFTPAVDVAVAATVTRSAADLGLGTLTTDGLTAVFGSGATIASSLTLNADPGWTIAYTLHVPASPSGLVFASASSGTRSADRTSLTLTSDAAASPIAIPRALDVEIRDGGATPPTAEDITSTIDVTLGAPTAHVTSLPITVKVNADVKAVDVATRFPGALPAKATLGFVSADGIRALHATGVLKDADLQKANDALVKEIKDKLTAAFGGSPTVTGGIDAASLPATAPPRPYATTPALPFVATGETAYALPGAHAGDLDLALDIGATVKFNVTLFSGDKDNAFTIHAPLTAVFTKAEGGALASDGKTATFTVPAHSTTPVVRMAMRGAAAPTYTAEDAKLGVTIDLKDLDVTLGKLTKGDLGDLVVDVVVTGDLGVVSVDKLPENVRSQLLGGDLDLAYLSGHAIRLAKERGLVSADDLTKIETDLLTKTSDNLASAMGGKVAVTGGFASDSLDKGASATAPIVFHAHAAFTKPVKGGSPVDKEAAALYTVRQTFSLPRVQGLDTGYTVILPRGLALGSVDAPGATTKTGTAPDGRDQFTVTPTSDKADATVAIAVTPTFVMIKFWPLVLAVVVVLLLLIGTPIAIVIMRRGRKGKAAAPEQPKK